MPDPLDALRIPLTPLAPRRRFAEELRRRLEAELRGPDPEGATMPTDTPVTVGARVATSWRMRNGVRVR